MPPLFAVFAPALVFCSTLIIAGARAPAPKSSPRQPANLSHKLEHPKDGAPQVSPQVLEEQAALVVGAVEQRTLPAGITPAQRGLAFRVVRDLRAGRQEPAQASWEGLIGQLAHSEVPVDVNALVQWVLRESYLENNKDLAAHADKVRYFNAQKKQVRAYVSDLRKSKSTLRGKQEAEVKGIELRPYKPTGEAIRFTAPHSMSRDTLADELAKWEEKLTQVGDDAQLANIDLQNMLQKQQQTLQTISNVSRMLHDTAMAIIRKIG